MPELLHFEITRAGGELHVRFVGRPRAPSAHPFPAATIPGGYRASVTLVKMDGPRGSDIVGRIADDDSVRIVRSNFALEAQDLEDETRVTGRRPPVLVTPLRVPLRGDGSSWSFRIPRAVFGSNRFHWQLSLSEVGSRTFERFDGDVDLTHPDRSERVPALLPGRASP